MGSVQFLKVPCSSLYLFSGSVGPFQCLVSANYRVLTCCTCHFQSSSLFFVYFGFLCLQVSSVPNFHPDTSGQSWSLIKALLFSCAVGREEHCKQITLACVGSAHSVCATLGLPSLMDCVYTAQVLCCSAWELSKAGPGLHELPRSKAFWFRFLGTPQRHRLSWACVLCPSPV